MRKHNFNEDFFENITTEKQAYWLGFICADGYINARGNTVGITLDIKDEGHLIKFLKDLDSNQLSLKYDKESFNKNYRETDKALLRLYSRKMHSDLMKLGLTNKKSTDLKPLNLDLPEELINHFIRGYFDGDGCVFEHTIKYGKFKEKECYIGGFTFVGTFEFLTYINTKLPFKVKSLRWDKRTLGSYTLYVASKKRFKLLEEFLYRNSTTSLDRKREKCQIIKNKIEQGSQTKEETPKE